LGTDVTPISQVFTTLKHKTQLLFCSGLDKQLIVCSEVNMTTWQYSWT